ncbi:facilitated trehalose transporter Tret1-like isoform X2 [Daktulosphaira vitifoliae]|nr:facilitated trehalose transporter Tret1-like isoform X2 [Daktulosphaira vitifoliae]XP_050534163.1 facilitated trehalose transporter Tret1-like isoform X2 [Daktulosphaira vitifoliae]XP_050534165.1 facilitated trehalose transporter Tret1-like isoform X2 [Daktulosphaira vitifoliae]XP_050534166.1 facilitated trehalose transporter Tret1-like isoform X2 [Daktulosphaira vitifoliae]
MELETLMEEGAVPGSDGENNLTPASNTKNGNRFTMANGEKTQTTVTSTSNVQPFSESTRGSAVNLFIASYAANFGAIAAGCALTWSSPILEKFKNGSDSSISLKITQEEATWIGSLVTLGAAVGPILSGFLLDRLGRKNTVLFSMILSIVSWTMISFIPNLYVLYVARVLSGISVGLIFTAVPTYIAEIAKPDLRSSLGTVMQFFLCVGFLLEYIVGPYTSYLTLALVSLATPILCFATFMWMPESPYALLGKSKEDQALKSLRWLRGNPLETFVVKELNEIKKSVEESKNKNSGFSELFANKGSIKAVIISLSMVAFQQLCGINVILLYSESIFKAASATISSSMCTIIIGSVMLGAASITPSLAKFSSIKMLLYISAIGMFCSEATLGFYFLAVKSKMNVSHFQWLPITSLVIFIITYCLGFGPLPWAIMGEMFPSNLKSVATSLTASFCWLLGFVLTYNFPGMRDLLGMDFVFFLFAFFCIMALIFSLFILPDTEGKTLQEIQDILNGRTSTPVNSNCTDKAI